MSGHVIVLGAGFGGLELATILSEAGGGEIEVTLIDRGEGFAFGFSKLELMFGRATLDEVQTPYARIEKPGVRVLRETVTAIDPEARQVTTDQGTHSGDALVIALGADYDIAATPGWPRVATSSTPSRAPNAWAESCRASLEGER